MILEDTGVASKATFGGCYHSVVSWRKLLKEQFNSPQRISGMYLRFERG